jgi:plasmid maintenance system antidote protein VapI
MSTESGTAEILHVGDNQVMNLVEGGSGPFWMTLAQQAKMKHNRQLGTAKTRNKTKIELLKDLLQSGYDTTK